MSEVSANGRVGLVRDLLRVGCQQMEKGVLFVRLVEYHDCVLVSKHPYDADREGVHLLAPSDSLMNGDVVALRHTAEASTEG